MGCESSIGVQPSKATFSPIIRNLSADKKSKIAEAIEDDDLPELAILLEEQGGLPNSEISDQGLMWMLNHLCCRWDADNCLEFLLKQYFAENPRAYVDYVNAITYEGYTPLHLCGLWKAQKCFHVLHYYGGLNLLAKDKMYRTAYQIAVENKCKKMSELLKKYRQIKVGFTNIETQKLLSGDIISEDQKAEKKTTQSPHFKVDGHLKAMNSAVFNTISLEAEQKKKRIQEEKQRILQEKLKAEQEADKEKARLEALKDQLNQQKEQQEAVQRKRVEEERKYEEQLKRQEQELQLLKQKMQKEEEEKMMQQRAQQMRRAEEAAEKQKESRVRRMQAKISAVNAFKNLRKQSKPQPQSLKRSVHQPSKPKSGIPQQILKQYQQVKASGSKFIDHEFPAKNQTLGDQNKAASKGLLNNTAWLRPDQIFKQQEYKLFEGIDPNDIKQGSLGVCYMLATISALAKFPKNIENLFVLDDIDLGFYVLRLYINGKPKYMVVDDQIPCNKLTKSPLFTKPIGNQIWVLLLEKAWAKAIGDYLSAEAMTPDHIMEDLSGAPGYGMWFTKHNLQKSTTQKIQEVYNHLKMHHIVVITSGDKKIQGIANNHAYTVLDGFEENGRYLFKIRNPWGRFEWHGQYGEDSSLWTQSLKTKVGYVNKDDGIFFLTENQLLEAFVYYSIGQIKNDYFYTSEEFESGENTSVFYKFKVEAKGEVNIRVTQPFDRMVKDKSYQHSPMIFEVGQILPDGKVKFLSEGHQKAYWGAKSVHAFDQIMKDLDAGEYFIRIKMLWKNPSKYNKAVIAVYAPKQALLQRLPEDQGIQYYKQLMISFGESKQRRASGNIYYKILTMRGQFAFVGETDEEGQYSIKYSFNTGQMVKCKLDLGKTDDSTLQITVTKGRPSVGTAMRTEPAQGGTTGSVNILGVKQ